MSKGLGDEMPADLVEWMRGGKIAVVATIDADGWPYTMIMNWAVAKDPHTIRLSLDRRTQTLENIHNNGRVMLEILGDGLVYGIRGSAKEILPQMQHAPVPSAIVEVTVDMVKRDLVPGVEFEGPKFRWGALAPVMDKLDPLGIEELHTFDASAQ